MQKLIIKYQKIMEWMGKCENKWVHVYKLVLHNR